MVMRILFGSKVISLIGEMLSFCLHTLGNMSCGQYLFICKVRILRLHNQYYE